MAVFMLLQLDGIGQFNRYYHHDRDSITTTYFTSSTIGLDNSIVTLKAAFEIHSDALDQPWQWYLEKYDNSGFRNTQFLLNGQFPGDSSDFLYVTPSLVVDSVNEGVRFIAWLKHDSVGYTIYSCWINNSLDSINILELHNLPIVNSACQVDNGHFKPDEKGGYLYSLDIPNSCWSYEPGENMIIRLDSNGGLDWYRTFQDRALHSETIMDITRSPITGDIYFCGNEAKTKGNCFSTPTNRDCENYAFVYRCDSLGQNCTRIYHAQDSVDAHQECNFIQVLSDGNIAVFHPIVDEEVRVKFSTGTPRFVIMDSAGVIQKELLVEDEFRSNKFVVLFEEDERFIFIRDGNWEIPGNVNQNGQIHTYTYEVTIFENEVQLATQGIYMQGQTDVNSDYELYSAQRLADGRILVAGRMTHDSLNTTLPYMALSDTEGCFPEIPCVAVGLEDEELSVPNKQLTVYPNPTQSELNVDLSYDSEIMLLDLNGRTIQSWQGQQGENQLQLQGVSSGIYILKTATQTAKVVVR